MPARPAWWWVPPQSPTLSWWKTCAGASAASGWLSRWTRGTAWWPFGAGPRCRRSARRSWPGGCATWVWSVCCTPTSRGTAPWRNRTTRPPPPWCAIAGCACCRPAVWARQRTW
ncbi:hypothetical protein GBAR_LOCUS4238 [Geodia barretti]|uniref:Uncharacterized protein n=1 Tax=Geodia barretti TaxID=519541 RepID=A0AA35R759_GEOBA|nr:hypothetical protein GBAR_LOCUS4238 [Geodia barretti]